MYQVACANPFLMMFDLTNKIVLVIGGRGYLGQDICRALVQQNAIVVSADLAFLSHAAKKATPKEELRGVEQIDINVKEASSISKVVSHVYKKYGRIDTLIYSATSKPDDFYLPFTNCSLAGWQSVIDVELNGLFVAAQEVGKIMESSGQGNMIFISSIYGVVGNDQRIYKGSNLSSLYTDKHIDGGDSQVYSHAVYPVVKGGVISLARYLACYWGGQNIRVNCISPGGIMHEGENQEFLKKYSDKVPLGRKADLHEVSSSVVFLSSDESSYITGQNIIVDGGWTAW